MLRRIEGNDVCSEKEIAETILAHNISLYNKIKFDKAYIPATGIKEKLQIPI